MANKSDRDQCFADAVDALNDTLPDDQKIKIDHQQPWVKEGDTWRPATTGERIWKFIFGGTPFRVPDWTIDIGGVNTPGDNKFSGDSFSNRKSKVSGNTQLQDQNEMNEQQHPGDPDYQDLHLNPDEPSADNPNGCGCKGDPQPKKVPVPMMEFGGIWVPSVNPVNPSLQGLPGLGGAPAGAPIGGAPVGGVPVEAPVGGGFGGFEPVPVW